MSASLEASEVVKRHSQLAERILRNMITAAGDDAYVYRQRAKYHLTDVPAALFDSILEQFEIKPELDTRTRARMYSVEQLRKALEEHFGAYHGGRDT